MQLAQYFLDHSIHKLLLQWKSVLCDEEICNMYNRYFYVLIGEQFGVCVHVQAVNCVWLGWSHILQSS